jgi:hypothetical protein
MVGRKDIGRWLQRSSGDRSTEPLSKVPRGRHPAASCRRRRSARIDLLFAATAATATPAADEIGRAAEALKQAAVALNRRHAAGDAPPPSDAVLAFRRRLAASCAE